MNKYYFTFGCGQEYGGCYVTIEAPDFSSSRDKMYEQFGTKWAFQYEEGEWLVKPSDPYFNMKCLMQGFNPNDYPNGLPQSELYRLKEIKL